MTQSEKGNLAASGANSGSIWNLVNGYTYQLKRFVFLSQTTVLMKTTKRIFEMLPAILAWSTLLLPFVLFRFAPLWVSAFVMLYVFLWFLRAMEFAYFLIYASLQYHKAIHTDWRQKNERFRKDPAHDLDPTDVIHLIILPTYKEPLSVLRDSIDSIAKSDYARERIYFCLATEARDLANARKHAETLRQEFGDRFGRFFWIEHPEGLPDEIKGKGANISFAAKQIVAELAKQNTDFDSVLVTTLDADNRVHPQLLQALTYTFCRTTDRKKRAFQPIPLFFNNIWQVPTINRMMALSSGYWHLIEAGRPDRLRNFSSHSQPLNALIEMDFWDKTTIVEDGRQYWRSYLHFDGEYRVVPVFLPVYQDAASGYTYYSSLKSQFNQLRRWAWGSSDVAYFTLGIIQKWRSLPKFRTYLQYFRMLEGHYMWATAALFLAVVTPFIRFANPSFADTVFGSHVAIALSFIFRIALVGILVSMALTFLLTPPPPKKTGYLRLVLQWLLLPIATIVFGSLPALTTQTQLALGKKMEFNVTLKVSRNPTRHRPTWRQRLRSLLKKR